MRLDPAHLAALAAIVRQGSFDAAAGQLGVTASAISQRIKALEERMGTVLIERGQPCVPTAAGARLAQHAEDLALLEAQVLERLAPDTTGSQPRLRIAVNADSLATWLIPALATAPPLLFDLVIDDQDHSADWLRRGSVSAAITGHATPVPGCDCSALGQFRYIATASPAFMKEWFADGVTADSLARAPMMAFNAKDRLQHRWITEVTGDRLSPPTHHMASTHAFVDAALCGLGWGMNPVSLVRGHIDAGRLVALVPDAPLDIALYWQTKRLMARALDPLWRALITAAGRDLQQSLTRL